MKMKPNKIVFFLTFAFVFAVLALTANTEAKAASSAWNGNDCAAPTKLTSINNVFYYEISSPEELAFIAKEKGDWLNYNYILTNDIVLNSQELTFDSEGNLTAGQLNLWTPIDGFEGIFNGNGHSISGLYVNAKERAGLFTNCTGNLYNFSVKNAYIKGTKYVGGICSDFTRTGGEFENISFSGAVIGEEKVGGLIGYNHCSYIKNCRNNGAVFGEGDYTAGIVGHYYAYSIENCINYGPIRSKGNYAAGIVGYSDLYSIDNCMNYGTIEGKTYVSGICPYMEMAYQVDCGNYAEIYGESYVGGLCGFATGESSDSWKSAISNGYNAGAIHGQQYTGGICGYIDYADVSKCYNIASVNGTEETGAIIGHSESIWGKGTVKNCYYVKNEEVNPSLNGFGNVEDMEGAATQKELSFFCITEEYGIGEHQFEWITDLPATKEQAGRKHEECSFCKIKRNENTIIDKLPSTNSIPKPYPGNENQNPIAIGSKIMDSKTKSLYKITGSNTAEYTKCYKHTASINIPTAIYLKGTIYKVTSIAPKAFRNNAKITKVNIGKHIKKIGNSAFEKCKSLKKITVTAGSLSSIGKNAFKNIYKRAHFSIKGKKNARRTLIKLLKNKKIGYSKSWNI